VYSSVSGSNSLHWTHPCYSLNERSVYLAVAGGGAEGNPSEWSWYQRTNCVHLCTLYIPDYFWSACVFILAGIVCLCVYVYVASLSYQHVQTHRDTGCWVWSGSVETCGNKCVISDAIRVWIKHRLELYCKEEIHRKMKMLSFTHPLTKLYDFLPWNIKGEILKNAHAALLHTTKVCCDKNCQTPLKYNNGRFAWFKLIIDLFWH